MRVEFISRIHIHPYPYAKVQHPGLAKRSAVVVVLLRFFRTLKPKDT